MEILVRFRQRGYSARPQNWRASLSGSGPAPLLNFDQRAPYPADVGAMRGVIDQRMFEIGDAAGAAVVPQTLRYFLPL